jgi:pimeloyl-ACP methyl ester carboxylesterase
LLHGFPLFRAMWDTPAALLADRWRVITPDLRGFGDSPTDLSQPPSLDHMADDVADLLDRLQLDRVVLGGVSMGGYVAMSFLRRYADRVDTLVLINTKPTPDTPDAKQNRGRIAAALEASGSAEPLRSMIDNLLGKSSRATKPALVALVRTWIDATDPAAAAWAQRAMAARPDSRPVLSQASCPAIVIASDEDALTSVAEARAMAELFSPPAAFRVVPGSGHLSVVEQPKRAMAELRDALDALDGVSSTR